MAIEELDRRSAQWKYDEAHKLSAKTNRWFERSITRNKCENIITIYYTTNNKNNATGKVQLSSNKCRFKRNNNFQPLRRLLMHIVPQHSSSAHVLQMLYLSSQQTREQKTYSPMNLMKSTNCKNRSKKSEWGNEPVRRSTDNSGSAKNCI